MTEDDEESSGFSFGSFGRSDNDDAPPADDDDEDSEDGEVDEVATLEQTLERREEQIAKLRAEVERLEDEVERRPEPDAEDAAVEELEQELEDIRQERDKLSERVAELEETKDELKRTVAKRENEMKEYKKRANKRQEQAKSDAVANLVSDLRKVRSTLTMALEQDENTAIRDGVSSTLGDLDDVLERHGVTVIEPSVGDEVDPHLHEVVHKQASDEPAGRIAQVFDAGYQYGDRVLEAARVVVSTGQNEQDKHEATPAEPADSEE